MSFVNVDQLTRLFDLSEPWIVRAITGQKKRILTAVDCVNFQIEKGETYALVGESGSGKSTIAKMVAGLLVPTSGSVSIDSKDFNDAKETQDGEKEFDIDLDNDYLLNEGTQILSDYTIYNQNSYLSKAA